MPVLPGPPPVEVHLKRSARTRRFSLRVSRLDGKVTLSMPLRAREGEALAFLRGHEGWLRETLQGMPDSVVQAVGIGSVIPVEGRELVLAPGAGRGLRVEGDRLLVPGDPTAAGARVAAWLKVLARDRLAASSTRYAGLVGRTYATLALRDTRSRWGSCSPDGRLMYSWRLIMAPPAVLDYVAAHEVAHLVELNHSPAYWAVVGRICPDWQVHRAWLHSNGQTLHRLRFQD
jgi:predicted metal-dependent hydrolase